MEASHVTGIATSSDERLPGQLVAVIVACASGAILVAVVGLLGWITGHPLWASFIPDAKPIAPLAAGFLIVQGVLLLAWVRGLFARRAAGVGLLLAMVVLVLGVVDLLTLAFGHEHPLERLLYQGSALLATPTALISPVAAGMAVWCALAIIILLCATSVVAHVRRRARRLTGWMGLTLAAVAGTFLLGYLYQTPFLVHSRILPIAAPACLGFALLGVALCASRPGAYPLAWFLGSSTRAKLLRVFLPLVLCALLVASGLQSLAPYLGGINVALVAAVCFTLVAAVTAGIIVVVARQVGGAIDRAEAERAQAEAALLAEKERLLVTLCSIGDGVIVTDTAGCVELLNPVAEALTGWTLAEARGRTVTEVFHIVNEDTRALVENPVSKVLETDGIVGLANHTVLIARDGAEHAIADSGAPIVDVDGRTLGVVLVFRDVTEERQAEEAIIRSRDFYLTLFETFPAMIWRADAAGRWNYVNQTWREFSGAAIEEADDPGMAPVHPEDRGRLAEAYQQALTKRTSLEIEYRRRRHDGEYRWLRVKGQPFADPDGSHAGYIGVCLDITDLLNTEAQLRQAVKMESVGRLAGGVAHDFNNILTGMLGLLQIIMSEPGHDPQTAHDLQEVMALVRRAANLTRQLLAFSRAQALESRALNLNALVDNLLKLLSRLIGEDILLTFHPTIDLDMVFADPGQLEQVLMNLAVNARDAMPTGGRMVIETCNCVLDADYAAQHLGAQPGHYVLMTVSDTGHGMTADVLRHIFEPFFTTKGLGEGTGLGLATVYGIVKQHDGNIWVYSEPGHGTVFKSYLPRFDVTELVDVEDAEEFVITDGRETILVVEDEPSVLEITQRLLTSAGYRVLIAATPDEAVHAVETEQDIALLLSDVIMPHCNGWELYQRLLGVRPDLRVLFMSGYSGQVLSPAFSECAHGVFLAKPFTPSELLQKIRSVLELPIDKDERYAGDPPCA